MRQLFQTYGAAEISVGLQLALTRTLPVMRQTTGVRDCAAAVARSHTQRTAVVFDGQYQSRDRRGKRLTRNVRDMALRRAASG